MITICLRIPWNVEMDDEWRIRKTAEDWMERAQDRDRWRAITFQLYDTWGVEQSWEATRSLLTAFHRALGL
jgi:hypothetical protein